MSKAPFAETAPALAEMGLQVIPLGGEDGKRPLIKGWTKRNFGKPAIMELVQKHGDCNIGLLTGERSNVVVVDADDPDPRPYLQRFGDTPARARTPGRNGWHLYYAFNGECSCKLDNCGLVGDLKADGGLVVIPPSFNRQNGRPYEWVVGGLNCLAGQLPVLKSEGIAARAAAPFDSAGVIFSKPLAEMREGDHRNDALFHLGLNLAAQCRTDSQFHKRLGGHNESFAEPLPESELDKVFRSVWGYKMEGRLFVSGGEAQAVIARSVLDALADEPDALTLLTKLMQTWGHALEAFPVSPSAMAKARTLPWTKDKIRRARDILIKRDFLRCVHRGGRRKGDPNLYRLGPQA